MSRGPFELEPVCYVGLSRNGLAALGSHERIKLTSGTLIGSCFVLSYALEMFPRYFCEKTETQLAVTAIVALTCPDLT